jgi:hypothetical protein
MELTKKKGTYAAVKFDDKTIDTLLKLISDNKIPNGLVAEDFHSTTCFSRKYLENFKALGNFSDTPWIGKPSKFGTFPNGEEKTAAILVYNCPKQTERFNYICDEYGATWDYDKYQCHVTLSYDIDNYNMKQLKYKKIKPLTIISEYTEELDLNKYK